MTNAAIYFHHDGFDTTGPQLLGRHSAGESFLRGLLKHADVEKFHLLSATRRAAPSSEAFVRRIHDPDKPLAWHVNRGTLGEVGVLHLPIPGLDDEAWLRTIHGETAYALCGITHTTATDRIMHAFARFLTAPLRDFDALICTSRAVRDSVETQFAGMRAWMEQEYGPRRGHAEPQRVTIPLGINVEDFRTSPEGRREWRERLDIPEDGVVALYVGRFNFRAKMNPALMALALETAARRTKRKLYWVNSGWAGGSAEHEAAFHEPVRALCPSVEYRHLDGRPGDVRFSIWSVADFFISFSDNIQETFGLTPVEAMAAGLPCVVTDWDGYRDTVRDGEDGFRIPTWAPAAGDGRDLAYAFHAGWLNYDNYVGAAGQFTSLDYAAAADAIVALAEDENLRRRMGAQAQQRAREVFDWSAVIPQYQALWAEQDARRRAAGTASGRRSDNPFRPDPFRLFEAYPTRHAGRDWLVSAPSGLSWDEAEPVLRSPLASYSNFNRPTLDEARRIFALLKAAGPATAHEVAAHFPPGRRPFISRGLLWMARFGALLLTPPA
jgi:glycosyltransferase involved in cell wall biosynthesis